MLKAKNKIEISSSFELVYDMPGLKSLGMFIKFPNKIPTKSPSITPFIPPINGAKKCIAKPIVVASNIPFKLVAKKLCIEALFFA
jgi:hypothetical protein